MKNGLASVVRAVYMLITICGAFCSASGGFRLMSIFNHHGVRLNIYRIKDDQIYNVCSFNSLTSNHGCHRTVALHNCCTYLSPLSVSGDILCIHPSSPAYLISIPQWYSAWDCRYTEGGRLSSIIHPTQLHAIWKGLVRPRLFQPFDF